MSAEVFPPAEHVLLEYWNVMVSPYKSASWTDSLILHLNFRFVTSEQYALWRLFHRKFPATYFSLFICYARFVN
jgi:hypothetical protein